MLEIWLEWVFAYKQSKHKDSSGGWILCLVKKFQQLVSHAHFKDTEGGEGEQEGEQRCLKITNWADLGRMGFLLTESGAQECRGSASHALAASENSLTNAIAIDHEVLGILAHINLLRVSPGLDVDHPSASSAAFRCIHRSLDGRVLA